jgi:hypothetical protein
MKKVLFDYSYGKAFVMIPAKMRNMTMIAMGNVSTSMNMNSNDSVNNNNGNASSSMSNSMHNIMMSVIAK